MKDLTIIILTFGLQEKVLPARYLPKVCHKVEDRTMIETCVENCLRLNPNKIILYVSKNNIQCINKVLKHSDYSKVISFYIFDNELNGERRLSIAQKCFKEKNILVVPGNAPLLSTKTLFRMISDNKNVKLKNNLFFLQHDSLDKLDFMDNSPVTDFMVPEMELKQVETKGDLEEVEEYLSQRKRKYKKLSFSKKL